jgi:hypothetical protein
MLNLLPRGSRTITKARASWLLHLHVLAVPEKLVKLPRG